MIISNEEYTNNYEKDSVINNFTDQNIPGGFIRLFNSMEECYIDLDVGKYKGLCNNYGPMEYLGMSVFYHSDTLILNKIIQFKGKKFVLLKNGVIACIFNDLNFLIRALVELDLEHYDDESPVGTILDADTGQAIYLRHTDPNHVHCNF